ncbi:SAM-dependent methyltransferase [Deinococcus detaillensis]|uniref:SAM-dependent methyltransferase n=1 Tax=Deinococcus detaillensis TaxID=2592048 RepID=UPI0021F084B1|nr:SAM-dependent methyltransferase [Deinococcus detaillensis]
MARIVETYRTRQDVDKHARVVAQSELSANDSNLNIPRYVDTSTEQEEIDVAALQTDMDALE